MPRFQHVAPDGGCFLFCRQFAPFPIYPSPPVSGKKYLRNVIEGERALALRVVVSPVTESIVRADEDLFRVQLSALFSFPPIDPGIYMGEVPPGYRPAA